MNAPHYQATSVNGRALEWQEPLWDAINRLPNADRLMEKVVVVDSGCWIWTGSRNGNGYGQIRIGLEPDGTDRVASAYRVSYEVFIGPVAEGLTLDHLCRERDVLRGTSPSAMFARNTSCKKCGGPLRQKTNPNRRECGPCKNLYDRKRHAKKRRAARQA